MTQTVAVLAFDQLSSFHLAVPCMVFGDAARSAGIREFQLQVCSEDGRAIHSSSGFGIVPEYGLDALASADILIIPSWPHPAIQPSEALRAAMYSAKERGALIVGLCLGAYALAATGLLDNRQATTHWAYMEDFHQRFPMVQLQPDVLYQQDDNVVTSAGTAAAIDCCLYIARQYLGAEQTNRLARLMVTAPHRSGGQAQFIELPVPERVGDKKLALLMDDIRADLAAPYSIDLLAQRMAMSRRTFTRHFKALTGQSVGQWLLEQRLRYCQTLLEQGRESIEQISIHAGFNTVISMRQHFRQRFGVSPSEWRKTFCEEGKG